MYLLTHLPAALSLLIWQSYLQFDEVDARKNSRIGAPQETEMLHPKCHKPCYRTLLINCGCSFR
uniref:Secreted protein n=1 Tax=Arundo donax TaxID=35708 RepID=A0A0A8XU98_ARUDO